LVVCKPLAYKLFDRGVCADCLGCGVVVPLITNTNAATAALVLAIVTAKVLGRFRRYIVGLDLPLQSQNLERMRTDMEG
jgi:hypothetical protein